MDLSFFDGLTAWVTQHQMWLGPAIFLISCVESLVVMGIVVPGVAMLFALGAIAGTGIMPVWVMLVWAFFGAVVGDGLSYLLGHRYHADLKKMWPFNKHSEWLAHGEKFFDEYGTFSVVIGRFVGAVRPFIPVVAGMMDMRPIKFFTVNILSALVWSPVYLLPGYFTGAAITMDEQLPNQLWIVLGSLCAAALLLPLIWFWGQRKYKIRHSFYALLLGVLFLALIALEQLDLLQPINDQARQWLDVLRLPWLVDILSLVTWLGSVPVTLSLIVLCLLIHYVRRQFSGIRMLLWVVPLMELSLWITKWVVNSARPEMIAGAASFSFPSGHTTQATFFILLLTRLCSVNLRDRVLWGIYSIALLLVMLVALSRLLLNVHWLGDVVAGFCLGLFWLSMTSVFEKRFLSNERKTPYF